MESYLHTNSRLSLFSSLKTWKTRYLDFLDSESWLIKGKKKQSGDKSRGFLFVYFKKILTYTTNSYLQWVFITGIASEEKRGAWQKMHRRSDGQWPHWLLVSLLGQLGLFIFGGCPLQTCSVHCERDKTSHEWKNTYRVQMGHPAGCAVARRWASWDDKKQKVTTTASAAGIWKFEDRNRLRKCEPWVVLCLCCSTLQRKFFRLYIWATNGKYVNVSLWTLF